MAWLESTSLWANEHVQGKHEQAELLYQRALIIYEKTLGPEHPQTAAIFYCLAFLCQQQERTVQAESFYQRALAIYEHALPPDHPSLGGILGHYASLLRRLNPRDAQRDGVAEEVGHSRPPLIN